MAEISISPEDIEYDDSSMVSLYSNSVRMETSIYDLQFIFESQYSKNGKPTIKQLARVIMSPLANMLNRNIFEYEKKIW